MGIYERLATLEREGGVAALATIIHAQGSVPRGVGTKMLVYPDGGIEGTIGGGELESRVIKEALKILEQGGTKILEYAFRDPEKGDVGVCGGEVEVFVEPLRLRPTMVVVGGGHVGRAVAYLARWLDFRVVVSDDRRQYASPQAVPEADETVHCTLSDLPQQVSIDEDTYLVLTTRGVDVDVEALPPLLETPAAYIGVIGSRRRWETTARKLLQMGVQREQVERVTSPIGLELNAETPEEIAVSVMAQIVMLRRGGSGESMSHTPVARQRAEGA